MRNIWYKPFFNLKKVLQLNVDLAKTRWMYLGLRELLIFLNIIQIFAQLTPLLFSDLNRTSSLISKLSYYIFAGFGLLSFLIEFILYLHLLQYMSHLIEGLEIIQSRRLFSRISNGFKKFLLNMKYFNYNTFQSAILLLSSLVARFDTFSDIQFIVVCLQTKQLLQYYDNMIIFFQSLNSNAKLAYISILTISMHMLIKYVGFFRYVLRTRSVKRVLNTDNIIQYYKIAALTEFNALSELLDSICPYNVKHLPDWEILGSWRNQSINNRILDYMYKFLFKNSPQIVLQTLFLLNTQGQELNKTVIVSMLTSILSFSIAFLKFLTIRPSTITQIHFNELAAKKQIELISQYQILESKSINQFKKAFPLFYMQQFMPQEYIKLKAIQSLPKGKGKSKNSVLLQLQNDMNYKQINSGISPLNNEQNNDQSNIQIAIIAQSTNPNNSLTQLQRNKTNVLLETSHANIDKSQINSRFDL